MTNLIEQMETQIQSWELANDGRAIFLTCYAMMTDNILQTLADNEFEDGVWVKNLTDVFAHYYFEALECYETNQMPPVWTATFEAACSNQIHVLQNLLLGVNAHICYDLIFAVADSIQDEWEILSEEQRVVRFRDYSCVNQIIAETLDAVQDEVVEAYSHSMIAVDFAFGRLDEWMINRLITHWRGQVWEQAIAYVTAPPSDRSSIRLMCAKKAEERSSAIRGQRGIRGIIDLF